MLDERKWLMWGIKKAWLWHSLFSCLNTEQHPVLLALLVISVGVEVALHLTKGCDMVVTFKQRKQQVCKRHLVIFDINRMLQWNKKTELAHIHGILGSNRGKLKRSVTWIPDSERWKFSSLSLRIAFFLPAHSMLMVHHFIGAFLSMVLWVPLFLDCCRP